MSDGVELSRVRNAGVAEQDQALARALDKLRGARWYVVATLDENLAPDVQYVLPELDAPTEEGRELTRAVVVRFLAVISEQLVRAVKQYAGEDEEAE